MLRSAVSKVIWVGRAAVFLVGLAVILGILFGATSMALANNNDNFILGVLTNRASDITRLTANVPGGPALQVINNNTAAGSKALQLNVARGKTPLSVQASGGGNPGKAINLNADKVDGRSFSCPKGTLFHEGVCIETTLRGTSTTFSAAQSDCLNEARMRLPTPAELQTIDNRTFRELPNHGYQDFSNGTPQRLVIMVNADGTLATTSQSIADTYRCVKLPR
jgi:hypothetical protein